MDTKLLLEQAGDLEAANNLLFENAQKEGRGLTDAETQTFDKNEAEAKRLVGSVERFKRQQAKMANFTNLTQQRNGGKNSKGEAGEKAKIQKQFRFAKAFNEVAGGGKVTGLEAEMMQEARNEATQMGLALTGKFQVPAFFAQERNAQSKAELEQRAVTVGGDGGNLVATELDGLIGILRPNLTIEKMGGRIMTGLVGDIEYPEKTAKTTGTWLAETATATESNPTYAKRKVSPHRLASFSSFSRQQLIQTSFDVELDIRNDLRAGISENVEYGIINGSGTDPVPFGILNTVGIGNVAMGTNGGVPTYGKLIDLQTEIAAADYTGDSLNYLTTPQMRGLLKQTQKFSGTDGNAIWNGNDVDGFGGYTSTLVPSDLTKGSSTNCHAILYGDFSQLRAMQWGGYDFIVDEVTEAKKGLVIITVNSFWDVFLRYKKAFAAIKDATLS